MPGSQCVPRLVAPLLRFASSFLLAMLWRSSSPRKVFGRSGTLCRRVCCKGRGQVPAPPETGGPLQATTRTSCCSQRIRVRGRHDGRHSLSRRFTHPWNPLLSRLSRGRSHRGSARLACARPAFGGRSRSSHYLQAMAGAHLTPRSAPPSKRVVRHWWAVFIREG